MAFGRDGCEQRAACVRLFAILALCACERTRALRAEINGSKSGLGIAQKIPSYGWDYVGCFKNEGNARVGDHGDRYKGYDDCISHAKGRGRWVMGLEYPQGNRRRRIRGQCADLTESQFRAMPTAGDNECEADKDSSGRRYGSGNRIAVYGRIGQGMGGSHRTFGGVGNDYYCAAENERCYCEGRVKFGHGTKIRTLSSTRYRDCTNSGMGGDPYPGQAKHCTCEPSVSLYKECVVTKLSNDHPVTAANAASCVDDVPTLEACKFYCLAYGRSNCKGIWYYTGSGRCCPKNVWSGGWRTVAGGAFYSVTCVAQTQEWGVCEAHGNGIDLFKTKIATATRNDYTGEVGFTFTVGSQDICATAIGRTLTTTGQPLKAGTTVRLWEASSKQELARVYPGANAHVEPDDNYAMVELTHPVTLAANTKYVLSQTTTGGMADRWIDSSPSITASNTQTQYVTFNDGVHSGGGYPGTADGVGRRVGQLNIRLSLPESCDPTGLGTATSLPEMLTAGWEAAEGLNTAGLDAYCKGSKMYGWLGGSVVGHLKATLHKNGKAKMTFGNCWSEGEVNFYVNGAKVKTAKAQNVNEVADFDYNDGTTIELKDENGNGVFNFISLDLCLPTPGPTPGPTPLPSPGPTRSPTPEPTPSPTRGPSRSPTRAPTVSPTPGPSPMPTPGPTPGPTVPVRVSGDPHATNLRGEKFEIFQSGKVKLFQIPGAVFDSTEILLYVGAEIDQASATDCHSRYMRRVLVEGNLCPHALVFDVGDITNVTAPFTFQAGESTPVVHSDGFTTSFAERVKVQGFYSPFMGEGSSSRAHEKKKMQMYESFSVSVKGARLQIQRLMKKRLGLSYLNVEAAGLAKIGNDVGGLLGFDDHQDQLKFKAECERSARHHATVLSEAAGSVLSAAL